MPHQQSEMGTCLNNPVQAAAYACRLQLLIVMPGRLTSHAVAVLLWQFPAGTLLP